MNSDVAPFCESTILTREMAVIFDFINTGTHSMKVKK